jgi:polysaccharide biosynthesis transport protein
MGQEQELERIKKIFWRRKAWFLWPLISLLLLTAIICVILPNVYKSTATVLILNQQIPAAMVPSTVTTYAQERIGAITQEVTSRSRILKLVEKYNLLPDKVKKLTTEELVDQIRKRISFQTINAEINKENTSQPVLLTMAFSLSYEDEDPGKAQAVTNEIVSFYLEKNLESREKVARGTTEFLTEQLKQEHARMDELQTRLADFQKEHLEELPEYSALSMQKLEKFTQRASDVDMQMRSLEEQRSILKGDQALLDPYSNSASTSKVMTPSERLQQLQLERAQALSKYTASHPTVIAKDQEITLLESEGKAGRGYDQMMDSLKAAETKLTNLKSTYTDKHPEVQSTEREIERIKGRLAESQKDRQPSSKISAAPTSPAYITLKTELEKLSVSISSLQAEKKQLEKDTKDLLKKLHSMPQVAKQFNDMETEYQSAKINYNTIEQKLLGARVSQGMEEEKKGESFQVVEPAFMPEKPAKPNRLAIMLVGAVLSLGLSVGAAATREFSDKRIHDLEVLQRISRFPVISIIPAIISEADIAARRKQRVILWVAGMCSVIFIILAVHFFVMDLDIVYAKLGRLVQKKIL